MIDSLETDDRRRTLETLYPHHPINTRYCKCTVRRQLGVIVKSSGWDFKFNGSAISEIKTLNANENVPCYRHLVPEGGWCQQGHGRDTRWNIAGCHCDLINGLFNIILLL